MAKVYVKFPKAGLGNLMLVWAKAKLFTELNGLPLITSSWWGFRWGAWLRNEKKKRVYSGYFRESRLIERVYMWLLEKFTPAVKNPSVKKITGIELNSTQLFVFDSISTGNDIFHDIREHRDYIRDELYKLLQPEMLKKLNTYSIPQIAVHIRRGDFKIGNELTDTAFFCDGIKAIRKAVGEDWPVTVFTDADPVEIDDVLRLPNTVIAINKPDILDILLMSRSRAMVLSKSSTFSYWAAFLSDAIVLRPFDDWQHQIRSNSLNRQFAEIGWKTNDTSSHQQLQKAVAVLSTN